MRKFIFKVMLTLFLLSMLIMYCDVQLVNAEPKTWTVDDDGPADFHTIQEAINVADSGDVILVKEGIYYENLVVTKPLSIIGENKETTVIDGNFTGSVIYISSALNISGFTIRHSQGIFFGDPSKTSGIVCSDKVTMSDNIIENNAIGVCLRGSDCTIKKNLLRNNTLGMMLFNSNRIIMRNNNFTGNNGSLFISSQPGYPSGYGNDIDTSNLVNGKPIYYLTRQNSITINPVSFPNIGLLYLKDSANVVIEDIQNVSVAFNNVSNCIVRNLTIYNELFSIMAERSPNLSILNNRIISAFFGIVAAWSSNCIIKGNTIVAAEVGVALSGLDVPCNNNLILANNFMNCNMSLDLYHANDNIIRNNNFISSTNISLYESYGNIFVGNYWSNYNGTDLNNDGIGETPYIIDTYIQDNHPLIGMFSDFEISYGQMIYHVTTICNSTITGFHFDAINGEITFNVTGLDGTIGYCRVLIPRDLIDRPYIVLVDGEVIPHYELTTLTNSSHVCLYFTYVHTTHQVIIIPEFSSILMLPLLIIPFVLIALSKKKRSVV